MQATDRKTSFAGVRPGENLLDRGSVRGGKRPAAAIVPSRSAGRRTVAPYLFLHADSRLQVRLARRHADGRCLAFDQFGAVRHARRRYFAPYSVQIVAAGRRRGTDCCALPSRVAAAACGCGARLSGDRTLGEWAMTGIASRSLAGFPYRTAGHVAPDPRRLGLHALDTPPISRERLSGDPYSSDGI